MMLSICPLVINKAQKLQAKIYVPAKGTPYAPSSLVTIESNSATCLVCSGTTMMSASCVVAVVWRPACDPVGI